MDYGEEEEEKKEKGIFHKKGEMVEMGLGK